jgi:hypothetical protein
MKSIYTTLILATAALAQTAQMTPDEKRGYDERVREASQKIAETRGQILAQKLKAEGDARVAGPIDALRGLNSVVEVGVNFRDYSTRVLDAKVKVDKYLADAPKDDDARTKMQSTMRLYVLALQAWSARIQKEVGPVEIGEEIMASPEFSTCGDMPQLIEQAKSKRPWYEETTVKLTEKQKAAMRSTDRSTPASNLASELRDHPGTLWKCAAEILKK